MGKKRIWPYVLVFLLLFNGALFGSLLGKGLAETINFKNVENFTDFESALPTRLLDINGELITEFSSDEKREIIAYSELPQQMIDALITREDRIFYEHPGFSAKAVTRAVVGKLTHRTLGGGSTLTQQIAGTLYCDRKDMSISRKLKEMWYAIQMERRFSKNEILELYLNKIYFGGGTYGVNAASKYYFGHSAAEITPAEAAILVIQLSNPALYNPFEHTNNAMARQEDVLQSMVKEGYLTKEEATDSYDTFWNNFDFTRTGQSAYLIRDDKAPWFSEYVRRELTGMMFGSEDIYSSGFTVHSTLNLSHQKEAEKLMAKYLEGGRKRYENELAGKQGVAIKTYIPMAELVTLLFDIQSLKGGGAKRAKLNTMTMYTNNINPIMDVMSLIGGMDNFRDKIITKGNAMSKEKSEKTTIEGTMVSVENSTGYINALVGGSKYDKENQFIRAVQAKLQPGSTFKPLYYSAGIESKKITMTTCLEDGPVVFYKDDGELYIPQNFGGVYKGRVEVWYALAHSLNIPSLEVLDKIGFDAAIQQTSSLLGIPEGELAARHFDPVYPLGLGVCAVRPIEMARAFAIFANGGREIVPMGIRTIDDKDGNECKNPEKEIRDAIQKKGDAAQIVSPQTAFIMEQLLMNTVSSGTLSFGSKWESTLALTGEDRGKGYKFEFKDENGRKFKMPVAGKTGTTQNWADAWTVGFTPYYTSVWWFGFDRPGLSLGLSITGASLAGPAWGDFMNYIHQGLPYKDFATPTGVYKGQACSVSGGLPTPDCPRTVTAWYLGGTAPKETCALHGQTAIKTIGQQRLEEERMQTGLQYDVETNFDALSLDLDFLNSDETSEERKDESETENINTPAEDESKMPTDGNWLLD